MNKLKELVGREVQLYPSDTYWKFGTIEEVNDQGILIKVTKSHPNIQNQGWTVDSVHFFANGSNLHFVL